MLFFVISAFCLFLKISSNSSAQFFKKLYVYGIIQDGQHDTVPDWLKCLLEISFSLHQNVLKLLLVPSAGPCDFNILWPLFSMALCGRYRLSDLGYFGRALVIYKNLQINGDLMGKETYRSNHPHTRAFLYSV